MAMTVPYRSTARPSGASLPNRTMRARLIIIDRVRGQKPPQMPFAKDQDVIQAVAPKRPDQALNIGILPG